MDTKRIAADDGRMLHPVALFCLRVVASAVLVAGVTWVVYEYDAFQWTQSLVDVFVIGGKDPRPQVVLYMIDYGAWAVGICAAGVLAAIIYIWAVAKRALPIILTTVGAALLCAATGAVIRIATSEAWKGYNAVTIEAWKYYHAHQPRDR